ncbi:MAG TPA: DUF2065 domain-containing protein [Gammaproteobacteria bacterium]|nr:DUF2065 domain-containing protein [Gammaproteobacteria bacterium]
MWQTLLLAFGLMLVLEGLLPTLNPRGYRRTLQMLLEMDDRTLRRIGLGSMISGALLVYVLTH